MIQDAVMHMGMVRREEALLMPGPFWADLAEMVRRGVPDPETGLDLLALDRLDPRVQGGLRGSMALARGLAQAWRTVEGSDPVPAAVLVGRIEGGRIQAAAVPVEQWPDFASLHFSGDGLMAALGTGSQVRRFLCDEGLDRMGALMGNGGDDLDDAMPHPASVTLTTGLTQADPLLARVAAAAGVMGAGAVLLWLVQPNGWPVEIGDAGGPVGNSWHPAMAAAENLSHSFLTPTYGELVTKDLADDYWYDNHVRQRLLESLNKAGEERGVQITNFGFLDALAEMSPLRKILPHHLTRFFPEVERIFWCLRDTPEGPVFPGVMAAEWDPRPPATRFQMLSNYKVRIETANGRTFHRG